MNDHRIDGGVPQGGQFTSPKHAESPVKLFDRTDGSFFKPSPSSTADHCINFWSNVQIPDEIIRQVEVTYHERRKAEVETDLNQRLADWKQSWLQENPKPRFKVDEWESKFAADQNAFVAQARESLTNERPMKLGLYDSRQLVRAAQMLYHAPDSRRFYDEHIAVRDHEIELFNETLTVEQIQDKYKLFDMHYAMESVFEDNTEKQILEGINSLNRNMTVLSEDVIDSRRDAVL
ncbi:hypothetical protein [Pseudarthrobacter sp. BIM B-2242]|uniref:hypothetical protein n=1 Tax=Pseudarthrobacter sp. BIM B-2242 TaxID=2772401 RepID=UPI00168B3EE3|nr:hypothetical protein [Pseudarthrobacter sp. BIM B-2242]QOD05893.1 hypothetical protein IDT60_20195 [Pseudarthrobacter sp. BIM B-2242]